MSRDLELVFQLKASIDQFVAGLNQADAEFSGAMGSVGRTAEETGSRVDSALGQLGMRRHAEIEREIQGVEAAYRDLAASGELTGRELVQAKLQMEERVRSLKNETNDWAGSLSAMKVELAAAAAAVYGITRVLGGAARSSSEFQTALAEVSTLLDDTSQMDGLRKSVELLSLEFGGDVVANSKALYQIISAGVTDAARATELLTQANKLAVGGVTDVATAADGLASIMGAYGARAGSAQEVSDALFVAMRAGRTTIAALSGSIGQVAPLAAQAGVGIEELLGSVTALTQGGVSTSQAMTQMRGVLTAVVKPTKQAADLAGELGLQFNTAAIRSQGLAGWLEEVREKTGGNEEVMAQLFGRVEGLSAVLALTGEAAEAFTATMEAMGDKAGTTEAAVAKMLDTPELRAARFKASMDLVSISLGDAVTALSPLLDGLTWLVNRFNKLDPATRAWALGIGAAAVAIPALLIAVAKLVTALGILRTGLLANSGGLAALATAAGAATKAIYAKIAALRGLRLALAGTGIGLAAVAAGYLAERLLGSAEAAETLDDELHEVEQTAHDLADSAARLDRGLAGAADSGDELADSVGRVDLAAEAAGRAVKELGGKAAAAGLAAAGSFEPAAAAVDGYAATAGQAGRATEELGERTADTGRKAETAFTAAGRAAADYRREVEQTAAAAARLGQETERTGAALAQAAQAGRLVSSATGSLAGTLTKAGWSAAEAARYNGELAAAYQALGREAQAAGRAAADALGRVDAQGRVLYPTMTAANQAMGRYFDELNRVGPALVAVADNVRRLDRTLADLDASAGGAARRTADLEQQLLELTATEEEIAAARAEREREQIRLELERQRLLTERAELLREAETAEQHRAESRELERQLVLLDQIQTAEGERRREREREREAREERADTRQPAAPPAASRTVRIELAAGGRQAQLDLPAEQADALEALLRSLEMGQITVQ